MRQLMDETTSENSMIPQTSQKGGRKIVFRNENERPHKKNRQGSYLSWQSINTQNLETNRLVVS